MNELDSLGFLTSDLIFNYVLKNKLAVTIYLEDGTKLRGNLAGWDSDFLSLYDGDTLQVLQVKKILRLQAELNNVTPLELPPKAEVAKPKFTPVLTEVQPVETDSKAVAEEQPDKPHPQDRLDSLVRNW